MKTVLRSILLVVAAAPFAVFAQFVGPEGRKPPVTAAEAMGLPDDSPVHLVGYITQSLGDERYEFRDDTGTLVVEIDDDDWDGVEVTPDVRVELSGEVDYEGRQIEIDVESVRLAQ
jgi:uncharacterized protein (TIGR00156 family)